MADYIFCMRKKSNPRIDVRICQEKCPFKDNCPEYLAYKKLCTETVMSSKLGESPLLNTATSES